MYITKETYYAYPQMSKKSGSIAEERQGGTVQAQRAVLVALFTSNGYALCENGEWAASEPFTTPDRPKLTPREQLSVAFATMRKLNWKTSGGLELIETQPPKKPVEKPVEEYDTKTYAETSLALEIAQKKAQIRQLQEELEILQGLAGNKIKI